MSKSKSQERREAVLNESKALEQEKHPKIKHKEVSGRIIIQKVTYYRGCQIYIRQYDHELFQYDLIFDNALYSSYIIAQMEKGQKKLTQAQVIDAVGLTFASACTTIDTIIEAIENKIMSNAVQMKKDKLGNSLKN